MESLRLIHRTIRTRTIVMERQRRFDMGPYPLLGRLIVGQNQPCASMVTEYERSEDTPKLGQSCSEGAARSPAFRTDLGDA